MPRTLEGEIMTDDNNIRDYVLRDQTAVYWSGALPWRSESSRRGYPTRDAAEDRARVIRDHYARTHGQGGPDLRVVARHRKAVS